MVCFLLQEFGSRGPPRVGRVGWGPEGGGVGKGEVQVGVSCGLGLWGDWVAGGDGTG